MKKSTTYFLLISGVVLLFVFCLVWIIAGPSRPIQLSKQTTYLTEPLRRNGLIDYEKALLEIQGADVAPEENAAIPFLQAMWPCDLTPEEQILVCDALQMSLPSEPGLVHSGDAATLEPIVAWLNQQQDMQLGAGNFTPLTRNEAIAAVNESYSTPWSRAQLPPLAAWIDRQALHFEKLHEMNDRPRFFLPDPALLDDQYDSFFTYSMPTIEAQREVTRSLGARAMLNIGENRPADAWEDIKTTFTLSRCHPRPVFIIDVLLGSAFHGLACDELCTLLNSGQCDAQLLDQIDQYLNQLKPFHDMPGVINISERFSTLDAATNLSAGNFESELVLGESNEVFDSLAKIPYDRNAMLQTINRWYDQLVAAMELDDLEERQAAFDQFDADLQTEIAGIKDSGNIAVAIFNQSARGEMIGKICVALLLPASVQAASAEDRANVQLQLVRVAVALEKLKVETSVYPESLAALTDRIDPALLNDPYSTGQFRYERREPGYLLYSLFLDRIDDGGSSLDGMTVAGDWISGDPIILYPQGDWVIRFPQPQNTFLDPPPWKVEADAAAIELETEAGAKE
ncbi:hypothetical protein M4951_00580 [Blastopirellula sp. J2-11]|uniref:hypothetical protein n=1 Tax=Blastopirellula sp. J2-11 TaxID=2943192 RepID=UPI0021C7C279|nr:hypothetical protein [Blastopirellula sp. J2-11]UUO06823.1 hypothetical protein M4951_00580 [Blastopirellula sp. J2-11]